MTAAEHSDWGLSDFTKKVFGAHQNSAESDSNLLEPATVEELKAHGLGESEQIATVEKSISASDNDAAANIQNPGAETRETSTSIVRETASAAKPPNVYKQGRQLRSAAEMAKIIFNALKGLDGVPERGFIITVYGANPWNAMLTIGTEAGAVRDAQGWRERVQEIAVRLRSNFDIIDEG